MRPHRGAATAAGRAIPQGVNFKEDKGPNSNPAVLTEEMLAFPPGAQLPIYDFHFNQIVEDPSILEDRATYADTYNIEVH